MSASARMASTALRSQARKLTVHDTIASIRMLRKSLPQDISVGFVPTMGALHQGHMSLVRQARQNNDFVFASIFVNPTQFAPGEDLDTYPRQLERDVEVLTELGVDHLFAPLADSMYGPDHLTYVDPSGFDDIAEGKSRPGHFKGVATIVTKLFNIVQPTTAYFGQKDAAQCVMIQRLVQDLNMDVSIVIGDTVRESDGLAMSSRNAYLTDAERAAAPVLYRALCTAKEAYGNHSEQRVDSLLLREVVHATLKSEPLVTEIQYVSVDSKSTMKALDAVHREEGAIISLACKIGSVRLIDNIVL